MHRSPLFLTLLFAAPVLPAFAQEAAPPRDSAAGQPGDDDVPDGSSGLPDAEGEGFEEDIVVTGQGERGAVLGDIPPEIQLDSRDIRAYGVSNLAELLDALAPQTGSGRGRGDGAPVVLLNGQRISGFREIRDLPPEAVVRVDILPEEVALKYGYRADQRVVNFVLRRRFRAVTAELEGGLATEGGRTSNEVEANIVRIARDGRWTLDAEYERESALLESERDIVQSPSSLPYDLIGNIGASAFGAEIDPALSTALGRLVTVAGVPAGLSVAPSLTDFSFSPNVTDLTRFRTLLPETEELTLNGTYNRTIFGNVGATLNASYERTESASLQGLPSARFDIPSTNPFSPFSTGVSLFRLFDAPHPLTQDATSETAHLGLSLNGAVKRWQWSFTANYDRARSLTLTDGELALNAIAARIAAGDPALNPFATFPDTLLAFGPRDRARSLDQSGDAELVATGDLAKLPAGDISATFKLGAETRGFDSRTDIGGLEQDRSLSRTDLNGQVSVDIPLASRRKGVLAAIGDLSANANFAVNYLSDFGTLTTYGGGVTWSPVKPVRIIASMTGEEGAPSMQQLGNPLVLVPNVRVFDFVRGETVDITRIDGGNPLLSADKRRVWKLGVTVKPLKGDIDLTVRADYTHSRIRNMIASFPTATAEIEAAFPDRFVRDQDGRLLSIDARPVNFARAATAEIRWGINFSKPIESRRPPRDGFRGRGGRRWRERQERSEGERLPSASPTPETGNAAASTEQTAPVQQQVAEEVGRWRGGGRGGFGGFGRGGPGRGGRLQFSLFHTWRLQDEVLIRDGVPKLDFLNGSAVGNRGGRPRHQIEAEGGISKNGYGLRINAIWQSGTTVDGDPGTGTGTGDLRFADVATVNLRFFADLGQQPFAQQQRWLRGTRLSLRVNNLFGTRPKVRDENGDTPLSYQPAYLDPLGRFVTLSLRKLFF